jgi:3-keto-5-aminohexanoate cleavage enzyme
MKRRTFVKTLPTIAALTGLASGQSARATADRKLSVENTPVVLECGINGSTTKAKNPNAPETVEEHISEMLRVLDAGATIAHNHSNQHSTDPVQAAQFYADVFRPVRKKYPLSILYATVNIDAKELHRTRRPWDQAKQVAHHRVLAEAGLANMVLFETGVSAAGVFEEDGVAKADFYFVYQFWPDDIRFTRQICTDFGTGASFSVYEPGWMKNIVAMAKAGTLPRGSKLNLYFGSEKYAAMAPPIPEALELYLKMMEGLDLKWAVACPGRDGSVMDTPLARMALERGGSLRVGLEDDVTGPNNVEQIERAKELVGALGRRIISGPEAIEYLDIPFPATRPKG